MKTQEELLKVWRCSNCMYWKKVYKKQNSLEEDRGNCTRHVIRYIPEPSEWSAAEENISYPITEESFKCGDFKMILCNKKE